MYYLVHNLPYDYWPRPGLGTTLARCARELYCYEYGVPLGLARKFLALYVRHVIVFTAALYTNDQV